MREEGDTLLLGRPKASGVGVVLSYDLTTGKWTERSTERVGLGIFSACRTLGVGLEDVTGAIQDA